MKPQLFLLHFAGGNNYSFQFMKPYLTGFDFVPLELPGRGKRISENLLTDFKKAAEDTCNMILARLQSTHFLIYGHSLGAILAIQVCSMLENLGKYPKHLIVTGNPGPGIRENKKRYLMPREAFKKELKYIGGVPDEILDNPELFDFFEPILKADFELVERYDHIAAVPVKTPVYAIMGSKEDGVERIDNWRKFALTYFKSEILEGNHFFIYKHPQRICEIIKKCHDLS